MLKIPPCGTGRNPTEEESGEILQAAHDSNTATLQSLSSGGVDITAARGSVLGESPLHRAAWGGNASIVNMLLGAGMPVDIKDNAGSTPLTCAVMRGHAIVIHHLIEAKADRSKVPQYLQQKLNKLLTEKEEDSNDSSHDPQQGDSEKAIRENKAYAMALAKGEANPSSISIYVLGQEKAGKSCLVSTLLGDKFEERIATRGADVDVCTVFASNWSRIDKAGIPKKLQKLFHTKLRVTAEIKISAEHVEPLSTASNKQELQKSLPELPAAVKADLERAKAAVLLDDDGINAVIWDFAGQSVYHGLHSMFLKEDNVAMIVFDASQNLHDPTQGRNVVRDPYTEKSVNPTTTGAETVCYWLKAIHSICHKDGTKYGSKSKFVPVVFLVATHIDALGDEEAIEQRKKQIIDWLVLLLQEKPYAQHLAGIGDGLRKALEKYCFFISNKVRNHKELDRLKFELMEASQYILSQKHPVVYLNIEKELFSTNQAVITTTEFHTTANKCGFFTAIGSEEFKSALAHFHSKGAILHFPDAQLLSEVVVLSPQWLAKLFAYVIVAHPYKLNASRHDAQYKRLRNHGILVEEFISCMVQKFNEDQKRFGFPLTTKQAIEFAELFRFIAEVNSSTYFLEEKMQPPKREDKVFIVPSMLPCNLPKVDTKLPADKDENVCIVYFKFPDHFIPLMVFYQMLAACINRNIKQSDDLCLLTRHMIKLVLGTDQYYYVTISDEGDSIRIAISPDEDGVVSIQGLQNRWSLIKFFSTKLKEVTTTFMPASAPPECYIPCSLCQDLHLKLDEIRTNVKPLRCSLGKLTSDYYLTLRQYPEEVKPALRTSTAANDSGDRSSPSSVLKTESEAKPDRRTSTAANDSGDRSLPSSVLKTAPIIPKLTRYLRPLNKWEEFGLQLLPEDYANDLVEKIKIENGRDVDSCKLALFRKFVECGDRTWQKVLDALEESSNPNLAAEVKVNLLKDFKQ